MPGTGRLAIESGWRCISLGHGIDIIVRDEYDYGFALGRRSKSAGRGPRGESGGIPAIHLTGER